MIKQTVRMLLLVALISLIAAAPLQAQDARLTTRWTDAVTPDSVLPEYPRPQMQRAEWFNLNGLWQYALTDPSASAPAAYDGEILVPFAVESFLSGVQRSADDQALWYQRSFAMPDAWAEQRVLLHFGAVDWETTVWVNQVEVGTHRGGYDAFSFDITAALTAAGEQEIVVRVVDPTDTGAQPRGKQVRDPQSIWYTSTTGIWQTAWLEPIPATAIQQLKLTPDVDSSSVQVGVQVDGALAGQAVRVTVRAGDTVVATVASAEAADGWFTAEAQLADRQLWSPASPFLYDVQIDLLDAQQSVVDTVTSYFGLRKIAVERDSNGDLRLFLNGAPLFELGLLDQGFWPDGLYTAPTDEALRSDIEMTRQMGFNTIRKHVKVEPERWYYWADKLGVLVWQDMPSGFATSGAASSAEDAAQFQTELQRLVETHYNHPSIIMWVPFNEGWGQHDTPRLVDWLKTLDPTRLVDNASGWDDTGVGDVVDIHSYPGPDAPAGDASRAAVLGEFGGLGLPLAGHTWQAEANWGYRDYADPDALRTAYASLITHLRALIERQGLAAAIYTQTTDVEIEVNGIMTYDRALVKMGAEQLNAINQVVYDPLPQRHVLVPTSEAAGTLWKYTAAHPGDDWAQVDYTDADWAEGAGGFGLAAGSPTALLRTEWPASEPQLWLRHTFTLESAEVHTLYLRVYHIEDVEIYLNGERVALLPLSTSGYVELELGDTVRELLRVGDNVLAVHVLKPSFMPPPAGAFKQFIDVGLYDLETPAS